MKIEQVFNGYKDANTFDVVVCFELSGESYAAGVGFTESRPCGELAGILDSKDAEVPSDNFSLMDQTVILEAAREYIRKYRSEVTNPSELLAVIVPTNAN